MTTLHHPIKIKKDSYLFDHAIKNQVVLPAACSIEYLASSISKYLPEVRINHIINAKFNKFLLIDKYCKEGFINAFNEIEVLDNDVISSKLITKKTSKSGLFTRKIEHVVINFKNTAPEKDLKKTTLDTNFKSKYIKLDSKTLYKDIVLFGKFFQNVIDIILLSENKAFAKIYSGKNVSSAILGSFFVIDASFHVACAWCKTYLNFISYPFGFNKRIIYKKTEFEKNYNCYVFLNKIEDKTCEFDIFIYDEDKNLCELILGLVMKPI